MQVGFDETIALVKTLLMPVVEAVKSDSVFEQKWDKTSKSWN